ncbi:MAG: molybdopterin cofactor-binding domain-containing protein, partial [bacterium]
MRLYSVAVVGATGLVGRKMIQVLEERNFPVGTIKFLASKRSAGTEVQFDGSSHRVEELTQHSFAGVDVALFSAGATISNEFAPFAVAAGTLYTPNAWVHIADDNTITLISARSEMGQGVYTSMPMLIAEELNVDLRKIKVAIAPPNGKLYGNPLLGGPQLTGGSTSVRDGWEKLRIAGAQVREMLVSAAATRWNVDRSQLTAANG